MAILMMHSAGGCSSGAPEQPYLYPTSKSQDIEFLCTSLYSRPDFSGKPFVNHLSPSLLTVTGVSVTYFFENNYSFTIPRDASIQLVPGSYSCE